MPSYTSPRKALDSLALKALLFYGTHVKHRGQERLQAWFRSRLHADVGGLQDVRRQGLKWRLDPADYLHRSLFWLGEYDRWDFYHFARLAKPGATVIDVGANFGYYTVTLASRMRPNCRFYAFEPMPSSFRLLAHNIHTNGLDSVIVPVEMAVSNDVGTHIIHEWAGVEINSGAASLESYTDARGVAILRPVGTVSVTTLDVFVAEQGIRRVDVMKIDVEGLEERVLRGGAGTVREFRPAIMIELHCRQLVRAGTTPERVVEWLRQAGYTLHVAERARLVPLTRIPGDGEMVNVFALPTTADSGHSRQPQSPA